VKDLIGSLATRGWLGESLISPVTGYSFVYHLEMYLLFAVLIAIGPLAKRVRDERPMQERKFGLAEFPG
jgi:BCD family chlorophyll transporter-like MFS transporter